MMAPYYPDVAITHVLAALIRSSKVCRIKVLSAASVLFLIVFIFSDSKLDSLFSDSKIDSL